MPDTATRNENGSDEIEEIVERVDELAKTCKSLKRIKKETMNLWEKEELCDVTLTAGNVSVKAHKIILASHSLYFRAMFCGNFPDAKKDTVEVSGNWHTQSDYRITYSCS